MRSRYIVVAGACLTQFTVIGLLFAFGMFFKVFETEFGWSRTLLSACSALAFLMMGTLAMVGGRLSDRYGAPRVLAASGVVYGLGFVLMSQVGQPWQLLVICATFMGAGLSTHDVVTLSTVARSFAARRGMMSAVVKVGTALGQVAVPPLVAALILRMGWQSTLMAMGLAATALLLVAALMMRPPGPVIRSGARPAITPEGQSYGEARRGRVFWTLCAIQFLFFTSLMTVPTHLAVHGMDLGMNAASAAGLLSVVGASSIAGRLGMGKLADLIGGRASLALCLGALMASLAGFIAVTAHGALHGVVALYGFGHGGLFVVVSPMVAEYFGMRAHGAIFGTVLFFGTIGGGIGPVLAGLMFDLTGSYFMAFCGLLVLAALALALVLSLPRTGRAVPCAA
ncbi:MAG: MFS transporter [Jhaorihella sp.]